MSQWGSPERRPLEAPDVGAELRTRRASLLLSGVAGILALGAYTAAGAVGAALALLPAALRGGPRGREAPAGREAAPEPSEEPLPG